MPDDAHVYRNVGVGSLGEHILSLICTPGGTPASAGKRLLRRLAHLVLAARCPRLWKFQREVASHVFSLFAAILRVQDHSRAITTTIAYPNYLHCLRTEARRDLLYPISLILDFSAFAIPESAVVLARGADKLKLARRHLRPDPPTIFLPWMEASVASFGRQ